MKQRWVLLQVILIVGMWLGLSFQVHAQKPSPTMCPEAVPGPVLAAIFSELVIYPTTFIGNVVTLIDKRNRFGMGIAGITMSTIGWLLPLALSGLDPPGCGVPPIFHLGMVLLNLPLLSHSIFTMLMGMNKTRLAGLVGLWSGLGVSVVTGISMVIVLAMLPQSAVGAVLWMTIPGLLVGLGLMTSGILLLKSMPKESKQVQRDGAKIAFLPWFAPTVREKGVQGGLILQGLF